MTFLYDIGRVLLDFDYESSLVRLLPSGCRDGAVRMGKVVAGRHDLEAGLIDPDEFVVWAVGELGNDATPAEFRHAWQRIFSPNKPMWDCVDKLAVGGHRLILFSNINAIHWPWLLDAYPKFALFSGAVLSFEAGCLKPRPEIYQHAVNSHGLVADSTLYIDDMAENIAVGRQFGFHCWQYDLHDHAAFENWLAAFRL